MNNVIYDTLRKKDFVVKNYLVKVSHKYSLDLNDMLLLIYFMNQENPSLDFEHITKTIYLTEEEAMKSYDRLLELSLVESKTIKNEAGVMDEIISTDNIFRFATEEIQKKIKSETKNSIFEEIESEFGRPLSPMEYEVIDGWLGKYDESLIHEALKEAVFSNAKSLRYITRILVAWTDKGYKKATDIRREKDMDNTMVDLFTYDWMNDVDE